MAEKSFLVQKFAKIPFGNMHLIGYSVAGEETVVQECIDTGAKAFVVKPFDPEEVLSAVTGALDS